MVEETANSKLIERAKALVGNRSPLAKSLAVVPLAVAPSTQALAATVALDPGSVTYSYSSFAEPIIEGGGPLTLDSGNGTSEVALSGNASLAPDIGSGSQGLTSATIEFTNLGTLNATAGDQLTVSLDFDQSYTSSSGGFYDLGWDVMVTIDPAGENIVLSESGGEAGVVVDGFNFASRNYTVTLETPVFVNDLSNVSVEITLSADIGNSDAGDFLFLYEIDVNSLNVASVTFTDSDGDGVGDDLDNCTLQANADQRDSNGDGYGNVCDPDLNNDNIVNVTDLGLMKAVFFSSDADADFNGDGTVNTSDLGVMKLFFFGPPGPSGVAP